jgi:hypothetical protein
MIANASENAACLMMAMPKDSMARTFRRGSAVASHEFDDAALRSKLTRDISIPK